MRLKLSLLFVILIVLSPAIFASSDSNNSIISYSSMEDIDDLIKSKEENLSLLVIKLKECILIKDDYQQALEDYDSSLILRIAFDSNNFNSLLQETTSILDKKGFFNQELITKFDLISIGIISINNEILDCKNNSANKQSELNSISNDLNMLISSSIPFLKYSIINSQEQEVSKVLFGLKRTIKKLERKNIRFGLQGYDISEVTILTDFLRQKVLSADDYYLYSQEVSSENLNVMMTQQYLAQEKVKQEIISTKDIVKNIFKVYREFE